MSELGANRVIVCGSRKANSDAARCLVWAVLDVLNYSTPYIMTIIHGAASGIDSYAASWAKSRGAHEIACPANWERYGRKAGPIRNRAMLEYNPHLVIAFPGGRGTADMVKAAEEEGIPVLRIEGPANFQYRTKE